jgi:hypothetical protein
MIHGSYPHLRRRVGGAVVAAVMLTTVLAVPAFGATDTKTVEALATPSVYAGEETTVVVTLTNTTDPQSFGSANIVVPDEFDYDGPRIIEVRDVDVAPGDSLEVPVEVRAQCTAATATWEIQVKQSNDFNGEGNDFTLTSGVTTDILGDCFLAFTTQPASAERYQVITGSAYDPASESVAVAVIDGSGDLANVVTWWSDPITLALGSDPSGGTAVLSGAASTSQAGGAATFAPSLDVSAAGYRLVASTTGFSTESTSFDIVDDADFCYAGVSCTAKSSKDGTTAEITATTTTSGVPLTVSIDPADLAVTLDASACQGYQGVSGTVQFLVAAETSAKIVSITVDGSLVDRPLKKFEVCFAAPFAFTTKDGSSASDTGFTFNGLTVYAGLLPDCELPPPGPPGSNPPPCVVDRTRDKHTKDVTITFEAPSLPQDPWGKI